MDPETVERKKANAKAVVFLFFLSFSLKPLASHRFSCLPCDAFSQLMMGTIRVERKPFMANGMLTCGVHKKFQV
jgi:hypothetical protein